MSQSEQPAKKLKLAQPLLNNFFSSQTSPTLPHYNPDSQPVEGQNKLIPLVQPAHQDSLVFTEFPEPEHIAPPTTGCSNRNRCKFISCSQRKILRW